MRRLATALLSIKAFCVLLDPVHRVFRPISEYQVAKYGYLGNVFVGLLLFGSLLVIRKQAHAVGEKLEVDSSRHAEKFAFLAFYLFGLTILLGMLFLTPIQRGLLHIVLAVTAMFGYSLYLLVISVAYRDRTLTVIAASMLFLCVIPAFYRPSFGVVENILIVCLMVGFTRFYESTMETDIRETQRQRQKRTPKTKRPKVRVISFDD